MTKIMIHKNISIKVSKSFALIVLLQLCAVANSSLFTLHSSLIHAQGLPFFRNYTAEDYHANNMNFDIETDENGTIYVANFEGLMYYDHAEWRIIRTPGTTRVTVCVRASDNQIWVGGYNYFGKINRKANGEIYLQRIGSEDLFRGEVREIFEENGKLLFVASNGYIYQVKDDKVSVFKKVDEKSLKMGMLDVVNVEALESGAKEVAMTDTVLTEPLGDNFTAYLRKNSGLIISNNNTNTSYPMTDANGLCSNDLAYGAYDGRGQLWVATGRGLFAVQVPSSYSRFTANEGLIGSVLSLEALNGKIYAGTDDGLFRQEGIRFVRVTGINHACWNLKKYGNDLLAATADGIYRIAPDGRVAHLTTVTSLAVETDGEMIYSGELNGIYQLSANGQNHKKVCNLENVRKLLKDKDGVIWAQSLYGTVWFKKPSEANFNLFKTGKKAETMSTIVPVAGQVTVVSAEDTKPFPYPLNSFIDDKGVTWMTNNEGKRLYRWKDGKRLGDMDHILFPLNETTIRTLLVQDDHIWIGSDNQLTVIDTSMKEPMMDIKPKLQIRSIVLNGDSVLWGGFGTMPEVLPTLGYQDDNLDFTYSLSYSPIVGKNLYRYKMDDDKWSPWSTQTRISFTNIAEGAHTFSVQAMDAMNRQSDIVSIRFMITPPFYKRWYMNLFYMLLMLAAAYGLFRLRLRKLEKDKIHLEKVIKDRTAEVVRLEKMATAGKLTQGLIDRILNPLNYINNFAKLSEGLVKDIKANVEDEKERMNEDNYEDTMDVLDMLSGNLQKVGEHGLNTTRTLKAMEEMLKDRSGGIVEMDLTAVIRQDEEMLQAYYKKELDEHHIQTVFDLPEAHLQINGNPEQLSKTIMSLLANAVYAVVKKANNTQYQPEITLQAKADGNTVKIIVRDNGIGIEDTITDKIFDPFFTTKTTGEAAGVGLYLSREIVQNHGGDISVQSVKNDYTEFTITLPYKKS